MLFILSIRLSIYIYIYMVYIYICIVRRLLLSELHPWDVARYSHVCLYCISSPLHLCGIAACMSPRNPFWKTGRTMSSDCTEEYKVDEQPRCDRCCQSGWQPRGKQSLQPGFLELRGWCGWFSHFFAIFSPAKPPEQGAMGAPGNPRIYHVLCSHRPGQVWETNGTSQAILEFWRRLWILDILMLSKEYIHKSI